MLLSFRLRETEYIYLKSIFVITSITLMPWSRHSEHWCIDPAGPRLLSFKARSLTSTVSIALQISARVYPPFCGGPRFSRYHGGLSAFMPWIS